MVNPKDDTTDEFEEEFEFDLDEDFEDEEGGAEPAPAQASSPVASRSKSKFPLLIVVIVAAAAGFGGWQFLQMGKSKDDIGDLQAQQPTEEPTPPQQQVAEPTPDPQPQQLPTSVDDSFALDTQPPAETAQDTGGLLDSLTGDDSQSNVQDAVSAATGDINKALEELKKEINQMGKSSKNVTNLEKDLELTANKIVNMDKAIGGLSSDINKLTRIVKTLVEQVNDLQQARTQVNAERAARARKSGQPRSTSGTGTSKGAMVSSSMTIHAIIPGRAWLRTQGGKTISVAEGDNLGEYGRVLKIDAPSSSVITSSGVTIR